MKFILIPLLYLMSMILAAFWMRSLRVGHKVDPELIMRGSKLIGAAKAGEVGYTEESLRELQNAYASPVANGFIFNWKVHTFYLFAGSFLFLNGIGEWMEGSSSVILNLGKMLLGFAVCSGIVLSNLKIKSNRSDAVKYLSIVIIEGI